MSKVTIALGPLIVGAALGFFWGNHTSTVVQAAPQAPSPAPPSMLSVKEAEPTIPPITMQFTGKKFSGGVQQLDGMEFKDVAFKNVTLEYSGGAFLLENVSFSTPLRVHLKGAAANTVGLALNSGAKPRPMSPNVPVLRQTTAIHTVKIDFNSPFMASQ
jgi:hypothetical protein